MATAIPQNGARFSLSEVASATSGTAHGTELQLQGVAIDSRACGEGSLFVAIRGEQHDGEKFLSQAVQNGARALLVHRGAPCPEGIARIEVDDTTRALGDLATYHRKRWGGRVVAITGSAGKTTTKELTAHVFAEVGAKVLKTQGNLNNQFGVPMTLFGLTSEHDLAVLEVGTSGPGEIARLAEIAQPNVGAVLLAAAAHTQGLGSVQAVAEEKTALFRALSTAGVCVSNRDDAEVWARTPKDRACVSFGSSPDADVRLLEAKLHVAGTSARMLIAGYGEIEAKLSIIGYAAAIDACAALACVLASLAAEVRQSQAAHDVLHKAVAGLARVAPTPGRMAPRTLANGVVVIDDTYNANPSSCALSVETLKVLTAEAGARSIAVLSDMKELGALSQVEHTRLGELCVRSHIDLLVGCGPEMVHATGAAAKLAAGRLAPHPTRVAHVVDALDAVRVVRSWWRAGDVVLVKGSRSMAMERVVSALCAGEAAGS